VIDPSRPASFLLGMALVLAGIGARIGTAAEAPGDAERGQAVFAAKQCVRCHASRGQPSVGPAIEELRRPQGAYELAGRFWNHAPAMFTTLMREGIAWPEIDCLVVPSRTTPRWVETSHPSLIEAMGHGVTVVGSDSGVIPELIDTAGLVVPEDDVGALTAALQHLTDAPRERARLGREARFRVMSEYVDEAVARRTVEFWETVLGRA